MHEGTTYEAQRTLLVRRGLRLEFLTVGWNLAEAAIALAAGWPAGSIALVGFGLDSLVESASGVILVWRLRADAAQELRMRVDEQALKLVGGSFYLLAGYVALDATYSLAMREPPDRSFVGIGLAVVSLFVMPLLARAKRKVAAQIASRAMHADSRQTDICAYLSAILLGGLVLNAWLGWWWADPVAALAMAPLIAREGWEAFQGKVCVDACP